MKKTIFMILILGQCCLVNQTVSAGPITETAKEWGVNRCIAEIEAIDNYLNKKAGSNGAWSSAAKDNASERVYSSLNIKKYNDGTWGYATMSVVPGKKGHCDGSLMQLVTFPNKSCNMIRETTYKEYKFKSELAGKALYSKGSVQLVLEDLTGSCIAIRYEALYPVPK